MCNSGRKTFHTPSTLDKIPHTLSLSCSKKTSAPKSLSPDHQDGNGIQGIRSSKMHLGCNHLAPLNINLKNLQQANRQLRWIPKHCEQSHSLLLIHPCNNIQLQATDHLYFLPDVWHVLL